MSTTQRTPFTPRIVTLGSGALARATGIRSTDLGYELVELIAGSSPVAYRVTRPALSAPPVEGFDLATAESWPTDEEIVTAIENPPAPAIHVPAEVPMWALRAVMDLNGLTASIDAILAQLPQPDKTIVLRVWEYGNYLRRQSPIIESLRVALGKTVEEVDGYFIQADGMNP